MPSIPVSQAMQVGLAHHKAGRLAQAEAIYRQVLATDSRHADAFYLLGTLAGQVGQWEAAATLIRQAIVFNPMQPYYHVNLAKYLRDMGRLDEAEAACRQALSLKGDMPEALGNMGNIFKDQGLIDEAIACYRSAASVKEDMSGAHSNLAYALHLHPDYNAHAILAEHRLWYQRHAQPLEKDITPHPGGRDPHRPLRIGYVSADFCGHAVGRFFLPLIAEHARQAQAAAMEVFCYADVMMPDDMTQRLQACAHTWRNIAGMADDAVARIIREDRIDILVDLALHTSGNRLLVFARKTAPIQVTFLGYCSTTGLPAIDYRLTDPYLDPPGSDESVYAEKSIRLPQTYWCYHHSHATPAVSALPALQAGHITFGCLNNLCKASPPALETWARLLHAVENSRLILHAQPGNHRQRLTDIFSRMPIAPQRLTFTPMVPWNDYFQQYHHIDIALDPFPYGGGTTTCDALWMGVPVITLRGQTAVGRGGASILSNVGLPQLIAATTDQYIQITADLAADLPSLAALRAGLRPRMQSSPLMDAPSYAQNIQAAYRQMWYQWCRQSP